MLNIIPKPKESIYLKGIYTGSKNLVVAEEIYKKFSIAWETFKMSVSPDCDGKDNLHFFENPNFKEEEYELCIRNNEIEITHSTDAGAFRAISTLAQIMAQSEKEEICCVKIHDMPDIPVRGIMIAVYENRIPKIETLYQTVDLMASLKYNMLQLYFDSVVFEYDSFSQYTKGKAVITKDEIHALDLYCRERHIELMANQEVLGHMHNWLKYDEIKHLAISTEREEPFTVNPLLDETFEFAKKILDDLLPHFSSSTVHIGMDEAYGLGLGETTEYCKTFGEAELLSQYITKISNYIREKYHKRCMIWGDYAVKYPDTLKKLPKDTIFVDWGYEPAHNFDRNIIACKNEGLDIYVSPGTQIWGTFSGRTDVMIQNIFESAESARFYKAEGFLLTNWGSSMDLSFPAMTNLSYVFGGAFSWNAGYNNSIAESGNEDNCRYRNEIVHSVLKHYDEVVLKSKGECSCAEIIYKMGNYYHFEQPDSVATWNGTQLYNTFFAPGLKNCDLTPESLIDIIAYMERLKGKLDKCCLECENADNVVKELKLIMDTVIAAANALGIKNSKSDTESADFIKPDTDELILRSREIRGLYNKTSDFIEKANSDWYNTFNNF